MTIADEIERLHRLKESGALSEDEFQQAKQRVLAGELPPRAATGAPPAASAEARTREWAMFLHISQLLGFLVPLAGLIAPLLIWQLKKDELPGLDPHGKVVMNWVLSALIYLLAASLLVLVVVGVPLLLALLVLAVVFPIIGGLKANAGELWRYPLSIEFLK
ncbi:hypothetical protein CKO31_10920 [Thiohalocapsa halophila]|uniref:SHOCT domain-containing protein n=1 Tax=Thiohalocapsa halophila TaxID=69359 RepID=A0ABS1CIQ8_9GAMM|nr:DUF4870 domain-containing protein [Thiohalocapsa halophila]MBK1631241.1 hypothetical protein [Thiohalocapsa halophila]